MTGVLLRKHAWAITVLLFVASLATAYVPTWPNAENQNALLDVATVAEASPSTVPEKSGDHRVATESDSTTHPKSEADALQDPVRPQQRVSTAGDSSMMFMNAEIAKALPGEWIAAPEDWAAWTSGTGGLDRNGCGVMGDQLDFYYTPDVGPRATRFNHAPEPESTCDWTRWLPEALRASQTNVLVASFGPTSMWGYGIDGAPVDITDERLRSILLDSHREFERSARSLGVEKIIWFSYPPVVNTVIAEKSSLDQYSEDPRVSDAYFELLTEVSNDVVDLRDLVDPDLYADGTHFNDRGAAIAAEKLIDHLDAVLLDK